MGASFELPFHANYHAKSLSALAFSPQLGMTTLPLAALALGLSWPSHAAEIVGRVVAVADGDTITVLDASKEQHKIKFAGIDAPERKQPFGTRSRQNLARYVAGKEVRLDCHKVDRYRRKVCEVWVQPEDGPWCGKTLDVGLAQVTDGHGVVVSALCQRADNRGPGAL